MRKTWIVAPVLLVLVGGVWLAGNRMGWWLPEGFVEIEGWIAAMDPVAGTFTIEEVTKIDWPKDPRDYPAIPPITIVTTPDTVFELRDDSIVTREEFFATVILGDEIDVEGIQDGNTIHAMEVEQEKIPRPDEVKEVVRRVGDPPIE